LNKSRQRFGYQDLEHDLQRTGAERRCRLDQPGIHFADRALDETSDEGCRGDRKRDDRRT
jgi:hypothetical protein